MPPPTTVTTEQVIIYCVCVYSIPPQRRTEKRENSRCCSGNDPICYLDDVPLSSTAYRYKIYIPPCFSHRSHIHTIRGKRGKEKKKKNHNSKSLRILSLSLSTFFFCLSLPPPTPIGGGEVQRRFPAGWPFPSKVDWIIGLDTSRDLGVCRPYFFLLPFLSLFFSGRRSSLRKIYIS